MSSVPSAVCEPGFLTGVFATRGQAREAARNAYLASFTDEHGEDFAQFPHRLDRRWQLVHFPREHCYEWRRVL